MITEMATMLPTMPPSWWTPEEEARLPLGQFDIRMMIICPGPIGWVGGWGYLAAWFWIPLAAWHVVRAKRTGLTLRPHDRVLLVLVPTLCLAVQALLRFTPLKYGYPLL